MTDSPVARSELEPEPEARAEGAAAEGAASVEWLFEGCAAALAGMGLEDATPLQAAELLIRTRKVGLIFSNTVAALRWPGRA